MASRRTGRAPGGPPRAARDLGDDAGGALVEFIAISLLLLIPVVYLVVTFSRIQAGAFAAEAVAHDAARAVVVEGVRALEAGESTSGSMAVGAARAEAVASVTLGDYGFASDDLELSLACVPAPCLGLGTNVAATAQVRVALPGIPGFVGRFVPLEVTVSSTSRTAVDSLAADS